MKIGSWKIKSDGAQSEDPLFVTKFETHNLLHANACKQYSYVAALSTLEQPPKYVWKAM